MAVPEETSTAIEQDRLAGLLKYAQVGRCVNGVTHDINNFLGAIMAYTELITLDSDLNEESKRMIGEILEAVRKSSSLLGTLTTIARQEKPNATLCEIYCLVERVVDLCRYDMNVVRIELRVAKEGEPGSLIVDEPKLIRALIHLITNGIEQVQASRIKRIEVGVCGLEDAVEVTVRDSGQPIAEAERKAIFEPFYTTKGDSHLGLGLAMARETLELHDGGLTYDPERGFVMRLPRENQLSL